MKKATLLTLALAIATILYVACADDEPTNSSAPTVIMPLAVGNEWQGTHASLDSTGAIVDVDFDDYVIMGDTTMANERWYKVHWRHNGELQEFTGLLWTNRSDGLWQRSKIPRTEMLSDPVLWLKYPVRVGEKYMANAADSMAVVSISKPIETDGGQYRCVLYQYDFDQGYSRTYAAPGVGLVKSTSNRFGDENDPPEIGWELTKAILN